MAFTYGMHKLRLWLSCPVFLIFFLRDVNRRTDKQKSLQWMQITTSDITKFKIDHIVAACFLPIDVIVLSTENTKSINSFFR